MVFEQNLYVALIIKIATEKKNHIFQRNEQ